MSTKQIRGVVFITLGFLGWMQSVCAQNDVHLESFLREYLAAQKKVRDFYEHVYLEATCKIRSEIKSGARSGSVLEATKRIHYWATAPDIRLDILWDDGSSEIHVASIGRPAGWTLLRGGPPNLEKFYWGLNYDDRLKFRIREACAIPWIAYCGPAPGKPFLEEFLQLPGIAIARISREKKPPGELVRIDFADTTVKTHTRQGSLWLSPQLSYVITQVEVTAAVLGASPRRHTWTIHYRLSDQAVPLIDELYERGDGPLVNARGEYVLLSSDEAYIRVTEIARQLDKEVFDPKSAGISAAMRGLAWVEYYCYPYPLGEILFYAQLIFLIASVSCIAYRRWRRRRLAGVDGGAVSAPA